MSAVSVNTYLRCINACFRWMYTEHAQALLKIPRLKENQKVLATLTADHIKRLLQYKPRGTNQARVHLIACVVLDCGLRISEALSLTWSSVDLDNASLKVKGKGAKERIVPISAELRKLLFRWQQRHQAPLLCCTRSGNHSRDLLPLRRARSCTAFPLEPGSAIRMRVTGSTYTRKQLSILVSFSILRCTGPRGNSYLRSRGLRLQRR